MKDEGTEKKRKTGLAGLIAGAFIRSRLTPLLVAAALVLGVFAVVATPREEEPQIPVPMIDVFVSYPGASASEVEKRVTTPMEKLLWEVEGVEYVYSIARPGGNLTIVRFYVGSEMERSIVRVYNKLMSNYDLIPPGVSRPLVKPKSINDVPILALTLWGEGYDGLTLREIASELAVDIKEDREVSETKVIGGRRRQVTVELDPMKLRAYGLTPAGVAASVQQANVNMASGAFPSGGAEIVVETGGFLKGPVDVGRVVVGTHGPAPVFLEDVARVTDGGAEPEQYVMMGLGPAARSKGIGADGAGEFEAVTISIAKKKGANATDVAERVMERVESLKGVVVPADVNVTVTRDYGETAKEKSDELLEHMMMATLAVIVLIMLALGVRESLVVAVTVPVTIALTLLVNFLYGYTLNRVTLFALIFSIGILVDDAIVVVENIHRHMKMKGPGEEVAVRAVDEVGNPTILATFTIIAALLPMAFVSGLMGPYMRPIPVGASAAMLFSLLVAFVVSPWLGYRTLKGGAGRGKEDNDETGRLHGIYASILRPLLKSRPRRYAALAGVAGLLVLAVMLFPLKLVTVKMLPFDNKSELQVVVDMPEGTALEDTARVVRRMGEYLKTVPEVTDYQAYAGTSAPFNFNGLVRHYYLRDGSHQADIQVNFVDKDERADQSHDIAKRLRPRLVEIAGRHGARVKLAEIPPGPPVLSTLVAEVYGPDHSRRIEIAREVRDIFETTPGVVDVDWFVTEPAEKLLFEVDKTKAASHGISTAAIAETLTMALGGKAAGLAHSEDSREPVEITLRLPVEDRTVEDLGALGVPSRSGALVPLSELVEVRTATRDRTIYHKNLKPVTYVTGDVAGEAESPVYAIMTMDDRVEEVQTPDGGTLVQHTAAQPVLDTSYSMKWDGEWHITYEVFRDLGIAFAAVLVLIYVLVVAWFRSFATPLVIMAPIPLTLVGVLPGHWAFGAFFTATSMIGFIALAGINVRNSILLVDFIEMSWRETADLEDAVVRAGAVRFRPILLTAVTVVAGSFVMIFDPIFQGLAISMMFGVMAAMMLTLVAVPLLYYDFFKHTAPPEED